MRKITIEVIDSHTGGEPTRVVIAGGPELGEGPLLARRELFRTQFDHYRSAIACEPRGADPVVGALLCPPSDPTCSAAVIFFNNVGVIGMCGHGTIGLMVTLAHLGRITPGVHRIETPVGVVEAELLDAHRVRLLNVPSYRHAAAVAVEVEGYGRLHGDIAWGGNWFFLVSDHGLELKPANIPRLSDCASRIRQALERSGIRGADGAEIDHIELLGPSPSGADSRNFVLCPGYAYDRSPCGTGTSAKLACLYADGQLSTDEVWVQESVLGSRFEARLVWRDGQLLPEITGSAYVNAQSRLIIDPDDPFAWGMRS
ncbi:proline racemase family protein [Chitinimonas lacunae]|uniref:Proline racemase family protein n=1 Tax=Chitinimonas lacunae TaxID=1963018 RepID=A0ABV8MVF9_9NEIS